MPPGQSVRDLHKLQRPGNLPQEEFAAFIALSVLAAVESKECVRIQRRKGINQAGVWSL